MENELEEIIRLLKEIKNKGTQTTPEIYFDMILKIMRYGGINYKGDIKRFFMNLYLLSETETFK